MSIALPSLEGESERIQGIKNKPIPINVCIAMRS